MSSGQTVVIYNHLRILNCVTDRFSQDAVFDPSNTDLMYFRFTVSVSGYVTGEDLRDAALKRTQNGFVLPDSLAGYPPTLTGSAAHHNPTIEEVAIRNVLMEPRNDFEMWEGVDAAGTIPPPDAVGDSRKTNARPLLIARAYRSGSGNAEFRKLSADTLSPSPSPDDLGLPPFTSTNTIGGDVTADYGAYDVNNGPRCVQLNINKITNNTIFSVTVVFEICKLECDVTGRVPNNKRGVLSNRWSVADSIDVNRNTTRTITGQLRVTTPYLNANQFRGWSVPALQAGFRRESTQFSVTADGLWLNYSITDREIHYSAPPPATSWTMEYSEHAAMGAMFEVYCSVTLRGPRDVNKKQLLLLAISIVYSKIKDTATGKPIIILDATATDYYGDNDSFVSVSVRARKSKVVAELKLLGVDGTSIGVPVSAASISAANPQMAAQPAVTIPYDETLSRGGYVADPIEVAGRLPVISAWTCYLQTACDQDHNTANETFTPVVNGSDAAVFDTFSKRVDYTPDSVRVVAFSIPMETTPSTYVSDSQKDAPYSHWQMDTTVEEDRLKVQLPVASASYLTPSLAKSTASMVALTASGITRRIVRAKGTRVGAAPVLPLMLDNILNHAGNAATPSAPSSGDPNYTGELIDATIKHDTPERTVDGKLLFTSYVELVYSVANSLVNFTSGQLLGSGGYRIGFNPWEQTPGSPATPAPVHTTGTSANFVAP